MHRIRSPTNAYSGHSAARQWSAGKERYRDRKCMGYEKRDSKNLFTIMSSLASKDLASFAALYPKACLLCLAVLQPSQHCKLCTWDLACRRLRVCKTSKMTSSAACGHGMGEPFQQALKQVSPLWVAACLVIDVESRQLNLSICGLGFN